MTVKKEFGSWRSKPHQSFSSRFHPLHFASMQATLEHMSSPQHAISLLQKAETETKSSCLFTPEDGRRQLKTGSSFHLNPLQLGQKAFRISGLSRLPVPSWITHMSRCGFSSVSFHHFPTPFHLHHVFQTAFISRDIWAFNLIHKQPSYRGGNCCWPSLRKKIKDNSRMSTLRVLGKITKSTDQTLQQGLLW